jgi:hypothetical protein
MNFVPFPICGWAYRLGDFVGAVVRNSFCFDRLLLKKFLETRGLAEEKMDN